MQIIRNTLALGMIVTLAAAGCSKPPPPRNPVTVSGQLVDMAGRPLAMKVVCFNPQEPDQKDNSTGTDAQGKFTLQLVPGRYNVTIAEPAHAPNGGADGTAGGVTAPEKGGKGIPRWYRNANDTPLQITVPDAGQSDLKLQVR